jgi:lipopolysaccharide/colanic/teichoic acid biosynthesis glycosyltransferase
VKINKNYVENYSFYLDLKLILKSIFNRWHILKIKLQS